MRLPRFWILLLAVLTSMLGGCCNAPMPEGVEYSLTSLNGKAPAVEDVTVSIRNGELYGSGPVNLWQAPLNNGQVGMMVITRRAGPPHAMQMENELVQAMQGAELSVESGQLLFTQGDQRIVFSLKAK